MNMVRNVLGVACGALVWILQFMGASGRDRVCLRSRH